MPPASAAGPRLAEKRRWAAGSFARRRGILSAARRRSTRPYGLEPHRGQSIPTGVRHRRVPARRRRQLRSLPTLNSAHRQPLVARPGRSGRSRRGRFHRHGRRQIIDGPSDHAFPPTGVRPAIGAHARGGRKPALSNKSDMLPSASWPATGSWQAIWPVLPCNSSSSRRPSTRIPTAGRAAPSPQPRPQSRTPRPRLGLLVQGECSRQVAARFREHGEVRETALATCRIVPSPERKPVCLHARRGPNDEQTPNLEAR